MPGMNYRHLENATIASEYALSFQNEHTKPRSVSLSLSRLWHLKRLAYHIQRACFSCTLYLTADKVPTSLPLHRKITQKSFKLVQEHAGATIKTIPITLFTTCTGPLLNSTALSFWRVTAKYWAVQGYRNSVYHGVRKLACTDFAKGACHDELVP